MPWHVNASLRDLANLSVLSLGIGRVPATMPLLEGQQFSRVRIIAVRTFWPSGRQSECYESSENNPSGSCRTGTARPVNIRLNSIAPCSY